MQGYFCVNAAGALASFDFLLESGIHVSEQADSGYEARHELATDAVAFADVTAESAYAAVFCNE
jgi:hypothetical protein